MVDAIAVFDVGKSNAKLTLVELDSQAVIASRTTPNIVRRDGPYPLYRLLTYRARPELQR